MNVLLTIDETSYDPGPGARSADHSISWADAVGAGRSWYTNLGHSELTYTDGDFAAHLVGGVLWATRCEGGCESGLLFRDGFEAASTCRWPGSGG